MIVAGFIESLGLLPCTVHLIEAHEKYRENTTTVTQVDQDNNVRSHPVDEWPDFLAEMDDSRKKDDFSDDFAQQSLYSQHVHVQHLDRGVRTKLLVLFSRRKQSTGGYKKSP